MSLIIGMDLPHVQPKLVEQFNDSHGFMAVYACSLSQKLITVGNRTYPYTEETARIAQTILLIWKKTTSPTCPVPPSSRAPSKEPAKLQSVSSQKAQFYNYQRIPKGPWKSHPMAFPCTLLPAKPLQGLPGQLPPHLKLQRPLQQRGQRLLQFGSVRRRLQFGLVRRQQWRLQRQDLHPRLQLLR